VRKARPDKTNEAACISLMTFCVCKHEHLVEVKTHKHTHEEQTRKEEQKKIKIN
jgi:hypothetical protein